MAPNVYWLLVSKLINTAYAFTPLIASEITLLLISKQLKENEKS